MLDRSIIIKIANLRDTLKNKGFVRSAKDIDKILYNLVEDSYAIDMEEDASDAFTASNIIGLRGDTTPEQPWGGIASEPFFSDPGTLN